MVATCVRRSEIGVLIVRDGLQPLRAALGRVGDVYGHVDHVGFWGGAVPVFLAWGEVDDASGFHLDGWLALLRRPAGTGYDVEDLAFRVGVPVRAGAGLEEDAVHGHIGRPSYGGVVPPHRTGKPVLGSTPGLHIPRRNDLHGASLRRQLSAFSHRLNRSC